MSSEVSSLETDSEFEKLLEFLKQTHQLDLTEYRRSSLMRRTQHRMRQINIQNYSQYLNYVETHPREFIDLFNTIEINHTSFFRDKADWDYIGDHIIPQILSSKPPDEPIRFWSVGCASGAETYTMAIVLAEVLGIKQFCQRVRIYGTDVDQEALQQARSSSYPQRQVTDIPPLLLTKYFTYSGDRYIFRKDLRHTVIFHRHNIIYDAPISQIDFLACRNTLIYFDISAQRKVLLRFQFSLKDNGFLFLGRSEMASDRENLFRGVNLQHRVFAKLPKENLAPYLSAKAFKQSNLSL